MYLYILKVSLTTKDIQPEISGTRTRYPKSHRHVDQIELLRLDWLWIGALAPCSHQIANHRLLLLLQPLLAAGETDALSTQWEYLGRKPMKLLPWNGHCWGNCFDLGRFGSSCGWMGWVDRWWVGGGRIYFPTTTRI